MKKIFFLVVVTVLAFQQAAQAEWRFAWRFDVGQKEYACSMYLDPKTGDNGAGGAESNVQMGVQGDGLITLHSDSVPFDAEARDRTALGVDDRPAVVHPELSPDGRTLTFTDEDSVALFWQFEEGSSITAATVLGGGKPFNRRFTLEGYRTAMAQYKGCRGLQYSPGWLGLFMTEAPQDQERITLIKKNAPYPKPGILVVTVDPRKEAYRLDLRPGDLITLCNGMEVEVKELVRAVKELEIGKSLELSVVRAGTRITKILRRPNDAGAGK